MRERRIQSSGRPIRIFYAFDPRRTAILLIGGRKTEQDRFYREYVRRADVIYGSVSATAPTRRTIGTGERMATMKHRPFNELTKDWSPERLAKNEARVATALAELDRQEREQPRDEGVSQATTAKPPTRSRELAR